MDAQLVNTVTNSVVNGLGTFILGAAGFLATYYVTSNTKRLDSLDSKFSLLDIKLDVITALIHTENKSIADKITKSNHDLTEKLVHRDLCDERHDKSHPPRKPKMAHA